MTRIRTWASVVCVFGVLMAACGSSSSSSSASASLPSAQYGVGRTTMTMVDPARSNRTLTVDVWYPTARDVTGPASRYVFVPGIEYPSENAIADAQIASGVFPLVVYAHGSSGIRFVSSFLTETLAQYGFVVVAADYVGNTALDTLLGTSVTEEQNTLNRAEDTKFVIDQMFAPSSKFAQSLEVDNVGITGHSFGGQTAMLAVSGWQSVPPDRRIKATVSYAPYTRSISDQQLAAVNVPSMIISGTRDVIVPIDPNTTRPWRLIEGRPLVRVDLRDAGHQSFSDVCAYQKLLKTLPNVPPQFTQFVELQAQHACLPQFMKIDTAYNYVDRYTVAFLKVHLANDASYQRFIVSDKPQATVQTK
jgi:predicted dienelactone hydrolase